MKSMKTPAMHIEYVLEDLLGWHVYYFHVRKLWCAGSGFK